MATAIPHIPVERFELKCGVTLLVSPRPDAPVCAVQAHIRGGHSLDPVGKEGLAYFTGRLVDQGTKAYDEEALAAKLEVHGASLSGGATGTGGVIEVGSWKVLLDLFCETLTSPTYPREQFERERRRLLDRLEV
ncbi:MAG: zinc protease, partial [Gammaproteobacteria bacterium]